MNSIVCAAASLLLTPVASAATFTVLHAFGSGTDASQSQAPLTLAQGKLFGTSTRGGRFGSGGSGTIFEYGLASKSERVVHSFGGPNAVPEGGIPRAPLLAIGGMLFGTTYQGGQYDGGSLFQFDPAMHALSVLHAFGATGKSDASNPVATATKVGRDLWGTSGIGGHEKAGAVYEYNRDTGAYAVIAYDAYPTQQSPSGPLTLHHHMLYGLTSAGGDQGCGFCGTLYAVNPATHAYSIVLDFDDTDGAQPVGAMINDGTSLYGVTAGGGTHNAGTIFKFDPASSALTTVHNFGGGSSGSKPLIGLTRLGRYFYGTTYSGGTGNHGIVFRFDPKTLKTVAVYTFTGGDDGSNPFGILAVNGVLYGTTNGSGTAGGGTLYSLTP